MKQFDLKEYRLLVTVEEYTIYEHPKTFHHVMVYVAKRNGAWQKDQVAQWNMPGLATDGPVVVPPGFVRAVIKKLGVGTTKKMKPRVEPGDEVMFLGGGGDLVDAIPAPARQQYYVAPQGRNLAWAPDPARMWGQGQAEGNPIPRPEPAIRNEAPPQPPPAPPAPPRGNQVIPPRGNPVEEDFVFVNLNDPDVEF